MDWIKAHLLVLIIGALPLGGVAFIIVQQLKKTFTNVSDASPTMIRLLVVGVCALFSIVCALLGLPVPCDPQQAVTAAAQCLATIDPSVIEKILAALLTTGISALAAMATHAGKDATKT